MIYKFSLIEKILLKKNIIPHPFVDGTSTVLLGIALNVAVKLKIVDHINNTPKSASFIAELTGTSKKGTEIILNCLEALGYIQAKDGGYRYTGQGEKFLSPHSPDNLRNAILFHANLYSSLNDSIEKTIINGYPEKRKIDDFGEMEWELFSRAMIDFTKTNLKEIISKINIKSSAKRIFDLGGSHGLYSIELCRKKKDMTAAILDFEPVRKYAEECITESAMEERVKFVTCDFMNEKLPTGSDIILLFNIIHGLTEKENLELFKKIFNSLNPDGQLIIFDQIKAKGYKTMLAKATTASMALNLFHNAGGNTYSFPEVSKQSLSVGFKSAVYKKINVPGMGLIICEK